MKKDNRGMSLIELMIAVAMLAVVMTPMFHSFLVSMKNNSKARNMFRATTVANNLMESLEAFSLEEICMQFNTSGNFKVYPQAEAVPESGTQMTMQYKELGEEVAGVEVKSVGRVEVDGELQYVFKGTPSKKYYFVMKNIYEDGNYFDAKITLDSSKYRVGDSEVTNEQQYNEQYSFDVDSMNTLADAVFICRAAEEKKAYEEILRDYNERHNPDISLADVVKKVKREIIISFDGYTGDDNTYENGAYVNLDVRYTFADKEYKYTDLVHKVQAVADVRNVYVMFYPNYSSVGTNVLDEITVITNRELPFKLYLIKQNLKETEDDYITKYYGSGASLEELDSKYWVDLNIKDAVHTKSEIEQDGFVSNVNLRTNISSKITATGNQKEMKQFSVKYYDKDDIQLWPDVIVGEVNANVQKIMQFVDGYPQSLAGEIKNENLMYETTIEIFPEGTYDSGVENMDENHRMLIISRK